MSVNWRTAQHRLKPDCRCHLRRNSSFPGARSPYSLPCALSAVRLGQPVKEWDRTAVATAAQAALPPGPAACSLAFRGKTNTPHGRHLQPTPRRAAGLSSRAFPSPQPARVFPQSRCLHHAAGGGWARRPAPSPAGGQRRQGAPQRRGKAAGRPTAPRAPPEAAPGRRSRPPAPRERQGPGGRDAAPARRPGLTFPSAPKGRDSSSAGSRALSRWVSAALGAAAAPAPWGW